MIAHRALRSNLCRNIRNSRVGKYNSSLKKEPKNGGKIGSQRIPADFNYFIDRDYVLDDRHKTLFFA